LPGNDRRDTHTDTQIDGSDFMKYVVEMGSVAIKIGSDIQKLIWVGGTQTKRWSHKPIFIFFSK
jgi:hypothetical protein